MASLEWTCCVRANRDTLVGDYAGHSVNSTCRISYRPLIPVSTFLLVRSFSNFKRSPWRCGQLWPFASMGSLRPRLHRDCNAMGDTAKISPHVSSTCVQNTILSVLIVQIIPSRQIYGAIDNPLFVPSVSWLTTGSCLCNHVCAADNISHAENLQTNGWRCFCRLYKFRDRIKVTRVFSYRGEHQD
jgi:hypothetical protein